MPKATSGSTSTFRPVPAGVTQAVCVDVIDLGLQTTTYNGEEKTSHKINIVWQVDERRDDGQRFLVYKRYTLSLHEKANLRKDIESWRGKAFTAEEEEAGFEVDDLKGWQCLLNVQHRTVGDRTYANVVSIMPLPKGMPKLEEEPYERRTPKATGSPSPDDEIPF